MAPAAVLIPGALAIALVAAPLLAAAPGLAPVTVASVRLGPGPDDFAGPSQDPDRVTDGFPPAYDVDAQGRVFVLDSGKDRVVVLTPKGRIEAFHGLGLPKTGGRARVLDDLSVGPDGSLAVADATGKGVWVFPTPAARPRFLDTGDVDAVRMGARGRLRVLQGDAVLQLGADGKVQTKWTGERIRPWGNGNTLFGARLGEGGAFAEVVRFRARQPVQVFAPLRPQDAKAYPVAADVIGVRPDGGPVAVLVSGTPPPGKPDPSDQRLLTAKHAIVLTAEGRVTRVLRLEQSEVPCRVTPRFHRVGSDGHLYTVRVERSSWVLLRHPLAR
jgi:hypothetical protein